MSEQEPKENDNVAKKALKEGTKSIKQKVISMVMPYIIPIILIVFAGALLLGIFNAIGDAIQDLLEGAVNGIVSFFTIDHEGAIDVTEEQVDTIINTILDMGISVDGLKLMGDVDYNNTDIQAANREAMKKYIKEFYEAQAITETLNTKPGWFENWTKGDKIYGSVYVYRLNDGATESTDNYQLDYLNKTDFDKKVADKASDIKKYFSIGTDGKLIFATTDAVATTGSSTQQYISVHQIDYKSAISQYTTKMNFFLYLAMVSENPEFVSAVTDLVKQSQINLTIMEGKTTRKTTEEYTYTPVSRIGTAQGNNIVQGTPTEGSPVTETTETTMTMISPKVAVTYAKTWFCEQSVIYNEKDETPQTETNTQNASNNTNLQDDPQKEAESDGQVVTWNIKKSRTTQTTTERTTYEEGTRGNVIDKTGNRGDGKSSFIGLLDVEFKIPNTTRYERAGENLVSGAELLFYLLQKDDTLQNLEQVMRYVLYKYTGDNKYGVTDFSELEEYFRITEMYLSSASGLKGYWTGECTKQEFIDCVTAYASSVGGTASGRSKSECYQKYFVANAENFYDICTRSDIMVDPRLVFSIGILESGYGTSDIANDKGNFWGWGAYDSSPYASAWDFTDMSNGIETVAKGLHDYMTPGTSHYNMIVERGYDPLTIDGIGSIYASDPGWASKVKSIMKSIFGNTTFSSGDGIASDMQQRIVDIALQRDMLGTSGGYCQAWVAKVYQKAGQSPIQSKCCAGKARDTWRVSLDKNNIPLGAAIYGAHSYSGTRCSTSNQDASHVGIYVGNGQVASNIGHVAVESLESFISTYGWGGWGWNGGIDYSAE